jgi:hypothetical protein
LGTSVLPSMVTPKVTGSFSLFAAIVVWGGVVHRCSERRTVFAFVMYVVPQG